ncbi:E3 ubiquitin-protein ligase RSL1-like [Fagus crenata]
MRLKVSNPSVSCVICLEDTDVGQIFLVDGWLQRYCFFCMKQHVEVKLLHGMVHKCPHEGCKSELVADSCQKLLTPKSIETMNQRIKEASIPVANNVYCPNPRCSALMSKKWLEGYCARWWVGAEELLCSVVAGGELGG